MAVFREAHYTMYTGTFIGGLVADVRGLPDAEHKISTSCTDYWHRHSQTMRFKIISPQAVATIPPSPREPNISWAFDYCQSKKMFCSDCTV